MTIDEIKLLIETPHNLLISFSGKCTEYQKELLDYFMIENVQHKSLTIKNDQEYGVALAAFIVWKSILNSYELTIILDKIANHATIREELIKIMAYVCRRIGYNETILKRNLKSEIALYNDSRVLFKSKSKCHLQGRTCNLVILHDIDDELIINNSSISTIHAGSFISVQH